MPWTERDKYNILPSCESSFRAISLKRKRSTKAREIKNNCILPRSATPIFDWLTSLKEALEKKLKDAANETEKHEYTHRSMDTVGTPSSGGEYVRDKPKRTALNLESPCIGLAYYYRGIVRACYIR